MLYCLDELWANSFVWLWVIFRWLRWAMMMMMMRTRFTHTHTHSSWCCFAILYSAFFAQKLQLGKLGKSNAQAEKYTLFEQHNSGSNSKRPMQCTQNQIADSDWIARIPFGLYASVVVAASPRSRLVVAAAAAEWFYWWLRAPPVGHRPQRVHAPDRQVPLQWFTCAISLPDGLR